MLILFSITVMISLHRKYFIIGAETPLNGYWIFGDYIHDSRGLNDEVVTQRQDPLSNNTWENNSGQRFIYSECNASPLPLALLEFTTVKAGDFIKLY